MRRASSARVLGSGILWFCLGLFAGCLPAGAPEAPRSPASLPAPSRTEPPGTALVISDLHFDPFADPAIVPWLVAAGAVEWRALLGASSVGTPSGYGSDANYPLLRSALDAARAAVPDPDFLVVPGDFLRHDFDKVFAEATQDHRRASAEAFAVKVIEFVALELSARFPDVPIFPVLGNNDTPCADYEVPARGSFLAKVARAWAPLVNRRGGAPELASTFPAGGYYSAKLPTGPRMRLIGLESVLWSAHFRDTCGPRASGDPGQEELAWLDATLTAARDAGEVAWIVEHIPPGVDVYTALRGADPCAPTGASAPAMMYADGDQARYLATIAAHAPVVRFALGGHTHMNDYRLYRAGGRPAVVEQLAPSVSAIFGNAPAFLVLRFDRATGAVEDVTTHALSNLRQVAAGGAAPSWDRIYDFDASYGTRDLSPESFEAAHAAIAQSPLLRARYVEAYSGGSTERSIAPTWRAYWCGNEALTAGEFLRCYCSR